MKDSNETTNTIFAENLRKLRIKKGLLQAQLGEQLFVNRSTVARWENGSRLPDAVMISRLSGLLGVDVNTLFSPPGKAACSPNVIVVDDRKIVLSGSLPVIRENGLLMTLTCREKANTITRDPQCLFGIGRFNRSGMYTTAEYMQMIFEEE
jgi:transcriptional regulator with XRE-family HTH domain